MIYKPGRTKESSPCTGSVHPVHLPLLEGGCLLIWFFVRHASSLGPGRFIAFQSKSRLPHGFKDILRCEKIKGSELSALIGVNLRLIYLFRTWLPLRLCPSISLGVLRFSKDARIFSFKSQNRFRFDVRQPTNVDFIPGKK